MIEGRGRASMLHLLKDAFLKNAIRAETRDPGQSETVAAHETVGRSGARPRRSAKETKPAASRA